MFSFRLINETHSIEPRALRLQICEPQCEQRRTPFAWCQWSRLRRVPCFIAGVSAASSARRFTFATA